jgi:tryptophanyl-tRNA synthetase
VFKLPEAVILEDVATVPGIDGRKMSKSYGNVIPLFGSPENIKKAVMAIVTDSTPVEEPKDPDTCNVFALHKLFSQDQLKEIETRYREGGMGYGDSKKILLENVVAKLAPFREKRVELEKKPEYVREVLRAGAEKARARVSAKLTQVREATGILTTL